MSICCIMCVMSICLWCLYDVLYWLCIWCLYAVLCLLFRCIYIYIYVYTCIHLNDTHNTHKLMISVYVYVCRPPSAMCRRAAKKGVSAKRLSFVAAFPLQSCSNSFPQYFLVPPNMLATGRMWVCQNFHPFTFELFSSAYLHQRCAGGSPKRNGGGKL